MIIVKLGGSAITDKSKPYTYIRGRVVKIASALRKHAAVYIHGAGSFGHPQVKAFGLTPIGISYIKAALRRLTAYVVEELIEAGVSAMPIEPSEVFWGRALARPEVVLHAVRYGLSPVLHGDVVPYEDGYVVVSGDEVAIELTKVVKPQAVVFLMDVDGVYTKPPGAPGAEKLREIPGVYSRRRLWRRRDGRLEKENRSRLRDIDIGGRGLLLLYPRHRRGEVYRRGCPPRELYKS